MQVRIVSRSGKVIAESENFDANDDVAELQKLIKCSPERQQLTIEANGEKIKLESGKSLKSFGVSGKSVTVTFKDLGPQIGWQTVFLIEYFGPIILHLLIYYAYQQYYGIKYNYTQKLGLYLVLAHFVKRELETLFVHRFSHAFMPLMNVFKNSFHYWILSGVLIALEVYSPWYQQYHKNAKLSMTDHYLVIGWILAELGNLYTHIALMRLRPAGTRVRQIPRGFAFDFPFYLSCPNYFFEVVAWLLFTIVTKSFTSALFFVVATVQMYIWAVKKHKNYRKEFKDYPRRKAMFPFIA